METLRIKKLNELAIVPTKGTGQSAGYDLSTIEDHTLMPMEIKLFKTGLSFAIPQGMYGRIAPRSGLAFKNGIDVLAGVIDEDYRNEIGVVLINFGKTEKQFKTGDKIAQIIFEFYNNVYVTVVDELNNTNRKGGFGSTDNINSTSIGQVSKENVIPITNRESSFNYQPLPEVIKKEPEQKKSYESKVDLVEQWKNLGGNIEHPTSYESMIKQREKIFTQEHPK